MAGALLTGNKTTYCSVDGCDREVSARGWCDKHWRRWRVHGSPTGGRPPVPPATKVGHKVCSKCLTEKPETVEFFGQRQSRKMESICRACAAARVRARWRSNPLAKQIDKANRTVRREKIRAYDRMRSQRDREKKKLIVARWIKNNPERAKEMRRAISGRRRARQSLAGGSFNADDIRAMHKAQAGRCWWCSKKLPPNYHVDHRVPIAKGGSSNPSNLVLACAPCNQTKNAKMPWEHSGRLL